MTPQLGISVTFLLLSVSFFTVAQEQTDTQDESPTQVQEQANAETVQSPLLSVSFSSVAQEQTDTQEESPTQVQEQANAETVQSPLPSSSILSPRLQADAQSLDNRFSITQHLRNYILPFTYVTNPNSAGNQDLTPENVDNKEAKFQLSVKLPLYLQDDTANGMYLGFTVTSFWQLYNSEVSKPFRETNYQPEIFYQRRADISILGYDFNSFQLGFNHMSNGQSGDRSRSWNRLFASVLFSDYDNVYYLKAWYRIPEDNKEDASDTSGDDNPDISDYYGRMEFGYGTRLGNVKIMALLRNNLNFGTNRGSIQVDLTYPLTDRYDLLLQYFNGYGDSLIDYNRSQERIGLGFQLTFL